MKLLNVYDVKCINSWAKKTINIGDHKVIFITHNLCGVFFESGWQFQARIKLNRKEKSFDFIDHKNRSNKSMIGCINSMLPTILRG